MIRIMTLFMFMLLLQRWILVLIVLLKEFGFMIIEFKRLRILIFMVRNALFT